MERLPKSMFQKKVHLPKEYKYELHYLYKIWRGFDYYKYIFIHNLDQSNWMRFVRPADSVIEQNLVLSQEGNHLFYTTTRSIEPKEELRVTYSEEYAKKRGLELFASSHSQNIFDRGRKMI